MFRSSKATQNLFNLQILYDQLRDPEGEGIIKAQD